MAKAPRVFQPSVVISSDLATGRVVFRRGDGVWSAELADAEIVATQEAADVRLRLARTDHDAARVVEPTLIEVIAGEGGVRPVALRELIRATGPTVPPAGK